MSSTTEKWIVIFNNRQTPEKVFCCNTTAKVNNILVDLLINAIKVMDFNNFCVIKPEIDEFVKLLQNKEEIPHELVCSKINYMLVSEEIEIYVHDAIVEKDSTNEKILSGPELSDKVKSLLVSCSSLGEVLDKMKNLEAENKALKDQLAEQSKPASKPTTAKKK